LQLLSGGAKAAYGYEPSTGRELWRIQYPDAWSAAPMPVFENGLAFFITGLGKTELYAVRVDGQGDVTQSHIAWKYDNSVAKTASPLLLNGLLYLLSDDGVVTCLEAATGQRVWRERLPGKYAASPIYGDKRIYLFNQDGLNTILKPGRTFEVLTTNTLSSGLMASPAVLDKALILRTKTHVVRIEE
jgi:outer membrane protein assembly factor BamB